MKIARIEDIPVVKRTDGQRPGTFLSRELAVGTPGTPGNFSLVLGTNVDGRYSPRHRHNFEQIRYQLEGSEDYDRDGRLEAGMVGYYPEGTHYGPQQGEGQTTLLLLQFGGPSGSGYMSRQDLRQGIVELKKHGVFENGIYLRNEGDGPRNRDAYEAVWEFVNGRHIRYPEPRYLRPVLMNPSSFEWLPAPACPGASVKTLGVFSEMRMEIRFWRLEASVSLPMTGRRLCFVIDGAGRIGQESYSKHTTLQLETAEQASFTASSPTEILDMGLPEFESPGVQRQAA
jgi:hypothetical protein